MSAKRGEARSIGHGVKQAAEILERIGPASYTQVWRHMPAGYSADNANKHCRRAEEYGLVYRLDGTKPLQYKAVPGWRDLIDKPIKPLPPTPVIKRTSAPIPQNGWRVPVNSVWELARV